MKHFQVQCPHLRLSVTWTVTGLNRLPSFCLSAGLCATTLLYDEGMRCGQSYKVSDLKKKLFKSLFIFEWILLCDFSGKANTKPKKKVRNFQSVEEERGEENKIQRIFQNTELHWIKLITCLCSFLEICRMIPAEKLVANYGLGWQYIITINIPLH